MQLWNGFHLVAEMLGHPDLLPALEIVIINAISNNVRTRLNYGQGSSNNSTYSSDWEWCFSHGYAHNV